METPPALTFTQGVPLPHREEVRIGLHVPYGKELITKGKGIAAARNYSKNEASYSNCLEATHCCTASGQQH